MIIKWYTALSAFFSYTQKKRISCVPSQEEKRKPFYPTAIV